MDIDELLTRGVANIIPGKEELRKKLEDGKLNIYLGIDPTAPQIHLGHAVALRKLNEFAQMGHNVTFLIGDCTALIGDTSDKDSERPMLTPEQIEQNFKSYKEQAEKILDFEKIKVVHNNDWLKDLKLPDIIAMGMFFSVGDFISRELIKKRLSEGKRVGLHELFYPIIQGYDSYHLDTDLQIGGTDQTFNMQAGRSLQKYLRNKDTFVLSTEFLMGTDGRKMSKTWDNAIWLDDNPNDMYAKVMSVNDDLVASYFLLGTNLPMKAVKDIEDELKNEKNPMLAKKNLARQIVKELHGETEAEKAEKDFQSRVQGKEMPEEVGEVSVPEHTVVDDDLLVKLELAVSKSEAKRLFEQGGVEIDGEKVEPGEIIEVVNGMVIKVGKRKFVKLEVE